MSRKHKGKYVFIIFILIGVTFWQHKNILRIVYPLKFGEIIEQRAKEYNLDPYLVYALIYVESHYDPNAQSHKDAKGLMQITPATGRWAAENLGIKDFNEDMLYEPEINIRIGCWYLYNLTREFGSSDRESSVVLMLAAYNGGSGNVHKWLNDRQYSYTGVALDEIPFKETREYVEKVLKNYKIYKWLY